MPLGRLSELQERVLRILASVTSRWTLSGGGALVGVHTRHRTTRDLDLFWQRISRFSREPEEARERLEAAGLVVDVQQRHEAFCRLEVRSSDDVTIVDLVADPVVLADAPMEVDLGDMTILVDSAHQILVNKLCAFLGRSELRDLSDVQALLDAGGDLPRALADAPKQDGGFSPLTLAWVLRELPIGILGLALGWSEDTIATLTRFRNQLVDRVLTAAVG